MQPGRSEASLAATTTCRLQLCTMLGAQLASNLVTTILNIIPLKTLTCPQFGVSDVFSKEKADLSCISKDSGLFVEELVQLVTVKVDNGSSSYNQITGGRF